MWVQILYGLLGAAIGGVLMFFILYTLTFHRLTGRWSFNPFARAAASPTKE